MDFIYLVMMSDHKRGISFALVAYESEEDANEDLRNRPTTKDHSYRVESLPFFKK